MLTETLPRFGHIFGKQPFTPNSKSSLGTLVDLETAIFQSLIEALDPTLHQVPVIIEGCADKNIPATAYVAFEKLQPHGKA